MKRVFFPLFALCLYNIGCKQESDEVSTTGPAQDGDQLCQCMKKAVEQSSNMRRALIECNQQEKEKYDQYISTPEDYSLFVESYESCLQKKENSKTANSKPTT